MFACPACGSRKMLSDFSPGEKIHCTCGMSYPASPVFAVAETEQKKGGGGGRGLIAVAAVLAGVGALAAWLMTHRSRPTESPSGPVAVIQPSHDSTPPEHPTTVPEVGPHGDTTPTPDKSSNPPLIPDVPADPTPVPPSPPPVTPAPPTIKPAPPSPPPTPVASLAAVTLWDAFDLDSAEAATRYAGKVVEVTGHGKVQTDSLDRPYFGIIVVKPRGRVTARMSPQMRQWEKEGYPPSVRCYLTPEQATALENVSPDQDVTIHGICTGRKDREEVYRGYIVELSDCTIMAPK
jgi:hypothetical protein